MTVEDALRDEYPFIIHADGEVDQMGDTGKVAVSVIQTAVGGYAQMVPINVKPRSWKMFVNEDGLQKRLPYNREATKLCAIHGTVIVGPAILARHV